MNLKKRISAILLICTLIITCVPVTAMADLTGTQTAKFKEGGILYDAYGRTYNYDKQYYIQVYQYNSDGSVRKIILDNENTSPKRAFLIIQNGITHRGYCIEHGVYSDETLNMKSLSGEGSISFYKGLSSSQRKNIQLALLYGWQAGKTITDTSDSLFSISKWYRNSCGKYNKDDWYIATQMLIWEIQQGYRAADMSYNSKTVSGKKVHKDLCYASGNPVSIYHYSNFLKGQGAYDIYRFMADAIKYHGKIASGLKGINKTKPQKIVLSQEKDADGNNTAVWSAIIRDNGKYPVSLTELKNQHRVVTIVKGKNKSRLKIEPIKSESGTNQYRISWTGEDNTDKPPEDTIFTIERTFSTGSRATVNNMLFWHWNSGSGGWPDHCQTIVTGSSEPQYFYISLAATASKPSTAEAELQSPEYFPEFEFPVSKEDANLGWDGDTHTGMGDAGLGATYTLYRNGEEVDSVTLDDNGNTEILRDKPWESDESFEMAQLGTYVHDNEGQTHCSVSPVHTEWTGEVTYTIEETLPDGRFVEPDSGIRTYTVSYKAYSDNSQQCTDDEVCWSEIRYDIKYSGGKTNAEVSGTVDKMTDVLDFTEETFVNDCYRGKITVTKSLEDEDIFDDVSLGGGKNKSTNSYWKLYLKNGFEQNKYIRFKKEQALEDGTAVYRAVRDNTGIDNMTTEMKIGTNGSIMILDVPYGEYYMEETTPDDASFVPEKFTVVIDKHDGAYAQDDRYDNRYDYDLRDKKIENKIKVVKTDAETGKTVSACGGAKFRIRYMGNHLLGDITSSANYGRLLPNAASINDKTGQNDEFECDENGYLVIPYMLKFGTYIIEEFAVPEGYCAGDKNTPVNYYTFKVENQNIHEDGNFGQVVDFNGNIHKADPSYKSSEWSYETYYQTVNMPNNSAKGVISIYKEGEMFTGWKKVINSGIEMMKPVYDGVKKLAGAVFGIFAAEDELLYDGNEGAAVYDTLTDEKIQIPLTGITHESNATEIIKDPLERLYNADVYETGSLKHNSGSDLWYLIERQNSENNKKRTVYITPEQKDTEYSYVYKDENEQFSYRYDVSVKMKYRAGGTNVTDLEITKTTISKAGGAAQISLTEPEQYIAGNKTANSSWVTESGNILDNSYRKFVYEADGIEGTDWNGDTVDFSCLSAERYKDENGNFVIQSSTNLETGIKSYSVMLRDGNTVECDENGNFQTGIVEVYNITYTQQADNEDGFAFKWDGFEISSQINKDKTAVTEITGQAVNPEIDCGIGYNAVTVKNKSTFTASEPEAPVYFMTRDNIKTQMYCFGNQLKADITIPAAAVKTGYENTVPSIILCNTDGEGGTHDIGIDWFGNLSYDNSKEIFTPCSGVTITAKYNGGGKEPIYYTIEIISDKNEDNPVKITYPDGYMAKLFCGTAASGNGVGVMELTGVYKTNKYPLSRLVSVMTTNENGYAQSETLPLGKYIVRELETTAGYVTDNSAYEVQLEYKDQNTPIVFQTIKAVNKKYSVEIDIRKVFETSYNSSEYSKSAGAVFGIYTAETISAEAQTMGDEITASVAKDTLIDTVTADKNNEYILKTKLPEGNYYVKEIKTKAGYLINETPYYFTVGDGIIASDIDEDGRPLEFDYKEAGVCGRVFMNGTGEAVLTVEVTARYPMPEIIVDSRSYDLNKTGEYDNITITQNKDRTVAEIVVDNGSEKTIILPEVNKTLRIKTDDNIYQYELDDMKGTYTPQSVYTGYLTSFSKEFTSADNETDNSPESPIKALLNFKSAGDNPSLIDIEVIHTLCTYEEEIDGVNTVKVKTDQDGNKLYEHKAEITVNNGEEKFSLESGEKKEFKDSKGTDFTIWLKSDGEVKLSAYGFIEQSVSQERYPQAFVDNIPVEVQFVKSVTHARSSSGVDMVKVKINSNDNINAEDIHNDRDKPEDTVYVPQNPESSEKQTCGLEITKIDASTGNVLAGAGFKIWSSDETFTPVYEITDEQGRIVMTGLEEGTYYCCETKAPDGYIKDDTVYEINIAAGDTGEIKVENTQKKSEHKTSSINKKTTIEKIKKADTDRVPATGDMTNMIIYIIIMLTAIIAAVLLVLRRYMRFHR